MESGMWSLSLSSLSGIYVSQTKIQFLSPKVPFELKKCPNLLKPRFWIEIVLFRPENDLRKKHPDRMFAAESFSMMSEVCEVYGPNASVYLSSGCHNLQQVEEICWRFLQQ